MSYNSNYETESSPSLSDDSDSDSDIDRTDSREKYVDQKGVEYKVHRVYCHGDLVLLVEHSGARTALRTKKSLLVKAR